METLSLRAYNREIEDLIDRGQMEEAIYHCRHILNTFPKHVDTYRLLGKAYLEAQRLGDAADIFQRVLSSIPDDFVSHLGMSIIREDEINWNEAIWHMERAFEIQPANTTIQDELRRLYGKRDGVEPPKVRLTRGALARMYCRGELYQQAIGELRAALGEDPTRYDLQALLARVYMQTGQKIDAADTANAILRKLPLCLEANRIMAEILSGSERASEAATYNQNLAALDPYSGFTSPEAPSSQKVADEAVTLEKLDWKSMQLAGVSEGQLPGYAQKEEPPQEEKEEVPEWLESTAVLQATAQSSAPSTITDIPIAEQEAHAAGEDLIPEWMKAQGWGPATGESVSEGETAPEEAVEAELPDWLQTAQAAEVGEAEITPAEELPDWLKDMESSALVAGEESAGKEEEFPEWLFGEEPTVEPEAAVESPIPPIIEEVEAQAEIPVEAAQLADEGLAAAFLAAEAGEPEAETAPMPEEELPAWLQDMAEPEISVQAEAAEKEAVPDWLAQAEPEAEVAPADELPDWLEKTEAEMPIAAEAEEQLPEWLQEVQAEPVEEQVESAEPEIAPEEIERPVETPEWLAVSTLEAPEAETSAEEAEIPDWLKETGFETTVASLETTETPAETTEIPAWAEDILVEEAKAAEVSEQLAGITAAPAAEEVIAIEEEPLPEWLQEVAEQDAARPIAEEATLEAEAPVEVQSEAAEEEISVPTFLTDSDESFRWLESLAVKQGASEGLMLTPEEYNETPPQWVQEAQAEVLEKAGLAAEAVVPEDILAGELPDEEAIQTVEIGPETEEVQEFAEEVEQVSTEWQPEIQAPVAEDEGKTKPVRIAPFAEQPEEVEQALPAAETIPTEEPVADLAWLEKATGLSEEAPIAALEPEEAEAVFEAIPEEAPAAMELPVEEIPSAPSIERLDLNRASLTELERLPGVGYIQAQAIVEYREKYGPFTSVDDLSQIEEISPASLSELRDLFVAQTPEPARKSTKPFLGLDAARAALSVGDIMSALPEYNHLIMERQSLPEIVADLEEAVQSHSEDADLWQSLGDAYMRNDQLQEALDAYTRAEQLLD